MKCVLGTTLILGLGLTACDKGGDRPLPPEQLVVEPVQNSSNAEPEPVAVKDGFQLSSAQILDLKYERGSHSLVMNLRYEGCGKTEHTLVIGACAESFPQQCQAQLLIPEGYDSSCKSLLNETFFYTLEDSFDGAFVAVSGSDKNISPLSALVDRKGDASKP